MDSLLDESCMDSDVISVDGDEIIKLTNTIVGVIYYYVSYSFFIYKFKRRFFQLKGNTFDTWNVNKLHKTCKRIKNLKKYNGIYKDKEIVNKKLYYTITIYNYFKSKTYYSTNKEGLDILYNELVRIINN